MTLEKEFMNRAKFSKIIEEQVVSKKLSYIDAVVEACDVTQIDPEDVKKFIAPQIKDKLEAEARQLNILPRQNTLYSV
jgi:hypothetical protein